MDVRFLPTASGCDHVRISVEANGVVQRSFVASKQDLRLREFSEEELVAAFVALVRNWSNEQGFTTFAQIGAALPGKVFRL